MTYLVQTHVETPVELVEAKPSSWRTEPPVKKVLKQARNWSMFCSRNVLFLFQVLVVISVVNLQLQLPHWQQPAEGSVFISSPHSQLCVAQGSSDWLHVTHNAACYSTVSVRELIKWLLYTVLYAIRQRIVINPHPTKVICILILLSVAILFCEYLPM